jgi:L-seryl-tRNA(Ser) seleniumtransferase
LSSEAGDRRAALADLPSVDEVLKSPESLDLLVNFPRRVVIQSIRNVIDSRRRAILAGQVADFSRSNLFKDIAENIDRLLSFSLVSVINATGVVLHTNLGRSPLSEGVLDNVMKVGMGYSNLEYDLETGKRGQRHVHTGRLLREITGAEDAIIVNNNAAAVLLCLNTLAKDREVIVSRGELVEIGGSFRVPDVMASSNAVLREVGTTNKTHLHDYSNAINEKTALILKVHQSNYKIVGFTSDVGFDELVSLGGKHGIPVMYDLGSGCLLDLTPFGIRSEPSVTEIIKKGIDLVTFSGDKLLGGPQGGVIAGRKRFIEKIRKNPLARAVRVDKLTIAAFESTLMEYMDTEKAVKKIPVLDMLFQSPSEIRARAGKIAAGLEMKIPKGLIEVLEDSSMAGGGSLPDTKFPTFSVSISPSLMSVNELELSLRKGQPPVIARIKDDALILDARTIRDHEIETVVNAVAAALAGQ